MQKYNKEKWGITETEYNKLMEAVEEGIVPKININNTTIYQFKMGILSVDDFIKNNNGSSEYSSSYSTKKFLY